ncbi:MAG TPA: dioxygenase [Acidimicrobiales bacterium]|nr:dioxygenase [Acidimicrobiales bacterium]
MTLQESVETAAESREQLLSQVLGTFENTPNPRLRQIMEAVVRHLHQLVVEVGLTRDEWAAAIAFLTQVGQICDEGRQEFILLSDTLGVSSLVEMINFPAANGATQNTVLGPFYVPGSPERQLGESIVVDEGSGEPLVVSGVVRSVDGVPLQGATVDVWETSASGLYAVQDPGQHHDNLRGVFRTAEDGRFEFRAVRPVVYSIPDDGPVGQMLRATGRHPMRAAHVHLRVSAPGHQELITHLFDADSDYLDSDAVFGVRPPLVVPLSRNENGELAAHFDVALSLQPPRR